MQMQRGLCVQADIEYQRLGYTTPLNSTNIPGKGGCEVGKKGGVA